MQKAEGSHHLPSAFCILLTESSLNNHYTRLDTPSNPCLRLPAGVPPSTDFATLH